MTDHSHILGHLSPLIRLESNVDEPGPILAFSAVCRGCGAQIHDRNYSVLTLVDLARAVASLESDVATDIKLALAHLAGCRLSSN